jgi:hypothetical protein
MTIADHPLHGSGRAALPHPALALGRDGKTYARLCAACRTRSSALGVPARLWVRGTLRSGEFPLATALPSTASAVDAPAAFRDFSGTTAVSDFRRSSIIGVCPWTSRCGLPPRVWQATTGPPGSRARCVGACAGSLTAQGPSVSCVGDTAGLAFRLPPRRRHPEVATACAVGHIFRGSIPGPHVPLSTLHPRPCGRRRMTRGRCGSLFLHRMTLSFTTSRRFDRRTEASHEHASHWADERRTATGPLAHGPEHPRALRMGT